MSDNLQHHKDGFSQWPNIAQCNGFVNGKRESEEASKGTRIHKETGDCYLNKEGVYCETALWASRWLVENENFKCWFVEQPVMITDCGRLTGVYGTPDFYQLNGDSIRVADLKSFSDGSKDYFSQLAGYALAIATMNKMPLDTSCELTVLHGLVKRAETRWYTVGECLDVARHIFSKRYDYGDAHTICDACKHCVRATDGTCKAQGAIIEATKVDMAPITFPVSQEQLIANPAMSAQVAIIAKAGVKFWERQFDMCKESARQNGGVIDDGNGCKFAFKTVNGRRTCTDLLALVARLNDEGITNDEIISKVDLSLTSLRELLEKKERAVASEIEECYFKSEGTTEKFERITK